MASKFDDNDTLKHDWVTQAIVQQTFFAKFFGYCDYHDVLRDHLYDKLESCYKLIGNDKKAKKYSESVGKRIMEKNQPTFAFYQLKPIFVHVTTKDFKKSGIYVIFRVNHAESGKPVYIDEIRTYPDWEDFLENNTLPKYFLFYPESGNYTPETAFKMEESEACSVSKLVRTVSNITAATATIVSSVALSATALFPILAPATLPLIGIAAGGSTYLAIDGVVQIVDLVKHDEKMSPTNMRALDAYLDIGSACGGLVTGGASAAAKFLSKDAAVMAKVLRYLKIAGSSVQGLSLIGKCLSPIITKVTFEDFKVFCLCCLNVIVHDVIPNAKLFINLFIMGLAINSGSIIPMLPLIGFKEFTLFIFKALLPVVLKVLAPKIIELAEYFTSLLCNKLSPHLPAIVDTDKFHLLKQDFFSLIEKANAFFNISDVLDIKFNGVRFFLTFSLEGLRVVCNELEKHLQCKESGKKHDLTQPELVKLWFKFMDLIRCCSPNNLIEGTFFLLKMLSRRQEINYSLPPLAMLTYYAESFLGKQGNSPECNEDKPLFLLSGMQVHEFYAPNVEEDTCVLSEKLKKFYREKTEVILHKKVMKNNSKFDRLGNGYNSVLSLSPCHEWRKVIFNRTVLKNGNVMLFIILLR